MPEITGRPTLALTGRFRISYLRHRVYYEPRIGALLSWKRCPTRVTEAMRRPTLRGRRCKLSGRRWTKFSGRSIYELLDRAKRLRKG